MKMLWRLLLVLPVAVVPLVAGALLLEVGNPAANPEALAKQAVLIVGTTACRSPEKTTITATAEGVMRGSRKSVPLNVVSLSKPGTFAITREWPAEGTWTIKITATNPDYKDYATSAVVSLQENSPKWNAVKRYAHVATEAEVSMSLGQ